MDATTVAGHRRVIVRTSDCDVVLVVSTFVALGQQIDERWIAFGMCQRYRYIRVQYIVRDCGPSKAKALPVFHALDLDILWQRQKDSLVSVAVSYRTNFAPTAAF